MKTNTKEIIKSAMAHRGYTQNAVAKMAGWKNQSSLATAINRDNPSVETLFRVLDAMGYDVIVQDRSSSAKWPMARVEGEE